MLTDPIWNYFSAQISYIIFSKVQLRDHILIFQEVAEFDNIAVR